MKTFSNLADKTWCSALRDNFSLDNIAFIHPTSNYAPRELTKKECERVSKEFDGFWDRPFDEQAAAKSLTATIAEMECRLGDLRRLGDRDLCEIVGLRADSLVRCRSLIGPPRSPNFQTLAPDRLSRPLERCVRKLLGTTFEAWQSSEPLDLDTVYAAVVCAATGLIGVRGIRWLGLNEPQPTSADVWFTTGSAEHKTLVSVLQLSMVCFTYPASQGADGRVGVVAQLMIVVNLFERILPIADRSLLKPLHYEINNLFALDRGDVQQGHRRPDQPMAVETISKLTLCRNAGAWFTAGTTQHAVLVSALREANRRFELGGQRCDGGRGGVIALLAVVTDLLTQLLPDCVDLLEPLRHDYQALVSLHRGCRQPLHPPPIDKTKTGSKTYDLSEFKLVCVLLADCVGALGRINQQKPGRKVVDHDIIKCARRAAKHLGINFNSNSQTIAEWRRDTPAQGVIGPNRFGELSLQKRRACLVVREVEQGRTEGCIRILHQYLDPSNFSHLEPARPANITEARRTKNREYQARYRQRQRVADK